MVEDFKAEFERRRKEAEENKKKKKEEKADSYCAWPVNENRNSR